MKRSNSRSYPLQTAPVRHPELPPEQVDTPTSIPSSPRLGQWDEKNEETYAHPQLPRNIHAVRDGADYKPKGRTIVVCLDGTGDKFDADNSSIVHLVSCLKKADPSQITYYQSGIGTYNGGGLSNGFNAALDMAVGSGLGVHVRDAYRFLMQNYREGDKICLFGFSRGAYTARCLAGMIHKVGLLPAHNIAQIPFAYQFYKDDTPEGWKMSIEFKRTFCMNVSVYFIGVFDSVASVGFIPRTLPLSSTPWNKSHYFRHAMALDEHRAKFKACRFQRKDHIGPKATWQLVAEDHKDQLVSENMANGTTANGVQKKPSEQASEEKKMRKLNELHHKGILDIKDDFPQETDVLEVWFAGAHCDVGGGAVPNEERHKLSQIPLRWMIRQCFECDTGIIFKAHRLADEGLDVHTLWPHYTSLEIPAIGPPPTLLDKYEEGTIPPITKRSTALEPVNKTEPQGMHHVKLYEDQDKEELHDHWVPEQVEDYFDSIAPVNDQLEISKSWWILECWPIQLRLQPNSTDEWITKTGINRGRFRPVQELAPNIHWTVKQRMETKDYKMRARFDRNSTWRFVV